METKNKEEDDMVFRKKLLSLCFMLAILVSVIMIPSVTSAEQAAAEQYRQMFRSGNFYVECQIFSTINHHISGMIGPYEKVSGLLTYAGKNGIRMQRTTINDTKVRNKTKGGPLGLPMFKLSVDSPQMSPSHFKYTELSTYAERNRQSTFGVVVGMATEKNYPDVLYKNGNYYQFSTRGAGDAIGFKKSAKNNIELKAVMLPESKMDSPYLDPNENWQDVKDLLSLPDELAVFYWEDKFHRNPLGVKPYYSGSSKRTVDDKEYDCDQYIVDIKSMANTNIAMEAYNMLYDNGQLVMIQKYFIYNGKERLVRKLQIHKITSEVSDEVFEIGHKCTVYAAATGDMNDLIDNSVIIEKIGGKEKK